VFWYNRGSVCLLASHPLADTCIYLKNEYNTLSHARFLSTARRSSSRVMWCYVVQTACSPNYPLLFPLHLPPPPPLPLASVFHSPSCGRGCLINRKPRSLSTLGFLRIGTCESQLLLYSCFLPLVCFSDLLPNDVLILIIGFHVHVPAKH